MYIHCQLDDECPGLILTTARWVGKYPQRSIILGEEHELI